MALECNTDTFIQLHTWPCQPQTHLIDVLIKITLTKRHWHKLVSWIVKPKSRPEERTRWKAKTEEELNCALGQQNPKHQFVLRASKHNSVNTRVDFLCLGRWEMSHWNYNTAEEKQVSPHTPDIQIKWCIETTPETACRASFRVHVFISQFITSTVLIAKKCPVLCNWKKTVSH